MLKPLIASLIILALTSTSLTAEAEGTSHDAYTVSQECLLNGGFTVYVSNKGVAAYSKKGTTSMLCVPPYKEVILFSQNTRKFYSTPFDQFRCPVSKTLAVVSGSLLLDAPVVSKKTGTYNKLTVHDYDSTPQFTNKQQRGYNQKELPGRAVHDLRAQTTDDFKCDPQVALVLNRLYGLPRMDGFPVYVEYHDLSGDLNKYLTSPKIVKSAVADAKFTLPTGLTRVKTHQDLYVGEDTADGMGLMMLGH